VKSIVFAWAISSSLPFSPLKTTSDGMLLPTAPSTQLRTPLPSPGSNFTLWKKTGMLMEIRPAMAIGMFGYFSTLK
jgi:hypothetical protein